MKFAPLFLAVCLASTLCGCASPRRGDDAHVPEKTPEMRRRAEEFSRTLSQTPERFAVLGRPGVDIYRSRYEALVDAIRSLGFNGVLCRISGLDGLEDAEDFIKVASKAGLKVKLLFREGDYNRKQSGEWHRFRKLGTALRRFNRALPEHAKLAGAVFAVEPHLYSKGNYYRPPDLLYAWDGRNYGIGGDNDMLVRYGLEQLVQIKNDLEGEVPMTVSLSSSLIDDAQKGLVSAGAVKDILKLGEENLIYTAGSKPSEAERNFAAAASFLPGKPLIAVNLAHHVSEDGKSLRRRDWNDLNRALSYLMQKHSGNIRGVAIGPFIALATLWERNPAPVSAPAAAPAATPPAPGKTEK